MARSAAPGRITMAAVALLVAIPVGTATAASPPSLPSSVAQYQEQLPTSTGGTSVVHALGRARRKTIPPALAARIRQQGSSDAPTLLTIARSGIAARSRSATSTRSTHAKVTGAKPQTTAKPIHRNGSSAVAAAQPVSTQTSGSWLDHGTWSTLLRVGVAMLVVGAGIVLLRLRRGA